MALYRRGTVWWVDLVTPDGRRIRESTKTENKQLATKYEAKLKVDVFNQHMMGIQPDRPFKDAVKYFLEAKKDCRSILCYEQQLEWWMEQFENVTLQKIDEDKIVQAILTKRAEGATNATLNRYLAALRATLRAVHLDRKWITSVPRIVKYEEPKERVRWLTNSEVDRLLDACPEHWRGMVRMSLATGLRQSNVRAMRWDWVDLERRTLMIPGEYFKNGKDFGVPLSDDAVAVLNENLNRHEVFVFTYQGRPISQISNTAWKAVLTKAGIEDFRWHDMRHTWATRMTRDGVPTQALQKLGGWETMSMVSKYSHHDVESLRQYVDKAQSPAPEPAAQTCHIAEKPRLRLVA